MSATSQQEPVSAYELEGLTDKDTRCLIRAGIHDLDDLVRVGVFKLQNEYGLSDGGVARIRAGFSGTKARLLSQVAALEEAEKNLK